MYMCNMYTYVYILFMYVSTHAYLSTCLCTLNTCLCTYSKYICTYVHVHMYKRMNVHAYIHMYLCMCVTIAPCETTDHQYINKVVKNICKISDVCEHTEKFCILFLQTLLYLIYIKFFVKI